MWASIVLFAIRCVISLSSLLDNFSVYTVFGYAGEAIGLAAVVTIAYEKWLWRWFSFGVIPVLKSQYSGILTSSEDGRRNVTVKIKQSFLHIAVIFQTKESNSSSIAAAFEMINGEQKLIYSYCNNPHIKHRETSAIHYGTTILHVSDEKLFGEYYTDRKTHGDLVLFPLSQKRGSQKAKK